MPRNRSRGTILTVLVIVWLLPFATTVLAWADLRYWNYFLVLDQPAAQTPALGDVPVQRLKQSILNVQVPACGGQGYSSGTSFVVSSGYVMTAAHVVKEHQACGSEISLIDSRGIRHRAELSGYSDETQLDLAILSFGETEIEPLQLAESSAYRDSLVEVVTIGYPPEASTEDQAALSGAGSISSFREGRFFTSGMDLNPGNSGGPVFLASDWTVLGVAIAKGDADAGSEGLGLVVPSAEVRRFFEDRVGRAP